MDKEALEDIKVASMLEKGNLEYKELLASFHIKMGNFEESERLFDLVLAEGGDDELMLYYLAVVKNILGKKDEAEILLKRAENILLSTELEDELLLSSIYSEQRRHEEALALLDSIIEDNPDFIFPRDLRTIEYMALKRYNEAIDECQAILSIDPSANSTLINYGYCLMELGRPREAIKAFQPLLAKYPYYSNAWSNQGRAKMMLGRYQEAMEDINKAIALKPNHPTGYRCRGELYLKKRLSRFKHGYSKALWRLI